MLELEIELEPCLNGPKDDPLCQDDEILDIRAYHEYLSMTWPKPSASAALVVFHNLVTASVTEQYMANSRRHYFCAQQVLASYPKAITHDLSVTEGLLKPTASKRLPGLSPRSRLVDCPEATPHSHR